MPDESLNLTADTLVADGSEPLKALETADAGSLRVGAYAVRFSDASEKDLAGEYFTKSTDFGPTAGNGVATLFNHGMVPAKSLAPVYGKICEMTFPPVKATLDDTGLFVETTLDLSDKYQKAIGDLVKKGKLKWSSGSAQHVKRANQDGEITRWHPVEFSYTPTPCEPRLPAIRPLDSVKGIELDADTLADLAAAVVDSPAPADPHKSASPTHPTVKVMPEDNTPEQNAVKARNLESKEILSIGTQFKCEQDAADFVIAGKNVAEFREHVLTNVMKARVVNPKANLIGMSGREVKQYSFVKAIRELSQESGPKLTGLELEASQATAKAVGREAKGFFIPHDVADLSIQESHGLGDSAVKAILGAIAAKNLNQTTFSQGGALVGTNLLTGSMIELLRNKPLMSQMGAMTLTGLVGNVALPKMTGGATAYWLNEQGTVPESDQSFGQLGLTPKRLVGDTAYTKELINQTDLSVEALVRNDLTTVLSLAKDLAAVDGTGGAQPLGILRTTGVGNVTFGGTPTRKKMIEFQKDVAVGNASRGALAYLTTPSVSANLMDTPERPGYPTFIWKGNIDEGEMVGRPSQTTNQVPGDRVIYGNFNDLILADWAGIDVVVDPYSLKKQGLIEITITLWTDTGVRHEVSFCVSTDSGAQ